MRFGVLLSDPFLDLFLKCFVFFSITFGSPVVSKGILGMITKETEIIQKGVAGVFEIWKWGAKGRREWGSVAGNWSRPALKARWQILLSIPFKKLPHVPILRAGNCNLS